MSLTLWMRDHVRNGDRFTAFVGKNSYAFFLIHSAILVAVSIGISGYDWHPLIKFAVSSVVAVPACFFFAWLLRKVPVLNKVL
jgi:peptidoglycan/LPS O-acetylase OafA/YrhL